VILPDWATALGGLYFVTPTTRVPRAKIAALSTFLTQRLSRPDWRLK
jgi:hypothetical protein